MRDSEATRRRLLEAGIAEFAAHGIAGARVDRIAETAGCNKQSIYGHFESKEGLFAAVYDAVVVQTISSVPIDAFALADYAGRLFDWYEAHPEVLRLATWQQLEGGASAQQSRATADAHAAKVAKIREAQNAGAVTGAVAAEHLLVLVSRLSMSQLDPPCSDRKQANAMRQAMVEAVRRLVAP